MNPWQPHFRAVNSHGVRRGLRLERTYWEYLDAMSQSEGRSVGDIIADIDLSIPEKGSLSSAVRAFVADRLSNRVEMLEGYLSCELSIATLSASTAPTFILSENKRILHYNRTFVRYVRKHFNEMETSDILKNMALTFDLPTSEIFQTLSNDHNKILTSGFAFGVSERRIRGKVNFVALPRPNKMLVMVFIDT
ncbi:MAG: ribbon-helix-helix domain-containing protein [Hyphomicrobiales bacterium]